MTPGAARSQHTAGLAGVQRSRSAVAGVRLDVVRS